MTSPKPDYFPKSLSPDAIILGIRILTCELGGGTIQFIATDIKLIVATLSLKTHENNPMSIKR